MTKKSNTKWFVYCIGGAGNESVAEAISGLHGATTDFKFMKCSDGEERPLYEVPNYKFAKLFTNRSEKMFRIFTSQNDGRPKSWETVVKNKKPKNSLAEIRRKSNAIVRSALQHRQR